MHKTFLLIAMLLGAASPAFGAEPAERTSSIDSRERLNVTVYNSGIALVHDVRHVHVDAGLNRIAWQDVSANIDATSALLQTLSGDPLSVIEQNFNYDLLTPSALLASYAGKNVTIVHDDGRRETARVLSVREGIVLQYADRIETEVRGHIVYPSIPPEFRPDPVLDLDVEAEREGTRSLDLAYLTGGLTWAADYVVDVTPDERHATVTGLVTLSNTTGVSYDGAHLQLVAGNVNVAPAPVLESIARVQPRTTEDTYAVNVTQESYFEYHLYALARPTTIRNQQTKQVSLLAAHDVPVRKTLELRGSSGYYQSQDADLGDRLPVGVYLTFDNRGGELGVPLPAGRVRVYKSDSRGTSQFAGSDTIAHTPKNESVRLHLGDSFDVTARKRQTDFRFSGSCSTRSSYNITLANAKDEPAEVEVVEPLPAQWTIVSETLRHEKSSSSTATWRVRVPAGGKTTLQYTADVTWCP